MDGQEVMDIFIQDKQLNVSPAIYAGALPWWIVPAERCAPDLLREGKSTLNVMC
jgi:hypothetical protein